MLGEGIWVMGEWDWYLEGSSVRGLEGIWSTIDILC